jgi:hypothetical protein
MSDFTNDVAFSLLDQDEPLAKQIARLLEGVTVFLYSERQAELVGTEGVEKFSSVFGRDARTVVVLFRAGWGGTKWTRIEETAIKERFFHEGAEFLTIIKLDSTPPPAWMPDTRIWGDLTRLRVEGVAAVLMERLRQAGMHVREDTPEELAVRIATEQAAHAERLHFLQSEAGVEASDRAANRVFAKFEQIAGSVGGTLTGEPDVRLLWLRPFSVTISWRRPYTNTLRDAVLYVKEWVGRPDIGGRFSGEKKELSERTFSFDPPSVRDIAWRDRKSDQLFSPEQLAEFAVKLALNRIRKQIGSTDRA